MAQQFQRISTVPNISTAYVAFTPLVLNIVVHFFFVVITYCGHGSGEFSTGAI
jgi:hypothetical protein